MSTSSRVLRRFEILLPKRFNDGAIVPRRLVGRTQLDLLARFSALSYDPQAISGMWIHEGQTYLDALTRLFVDVADTRENMQFFRSFKEILKTRFMQIDIWMVHFAIEVV